MNTSEKEDKKGKKSSEKSKCNYLRKSFSVNHSAGISFLNLTSQFDDVLYIIGLDDRNFCWSSNKKWNAVTERHILCKIRA